MAEKVKCKTEFDAFLRKATEWIDRQKQMLEVKPTPEQVEEITKIYGDVIRKAKEFATCEVASS